MEQINCRCNGGDDQKQDDGLRGCVSCPVGAEACVVDLERDRCRCAGGAAGSHGHRNVKCLKARRKTKDHIHDDNRRKQRELDPRDYRPFIRTVYCGGFQQVFGNILKSGNINDHIIARALPDRSQADRIHGQLHAAQPTDLIRFGDPKGKTPPALLLNSSYSPSFAAGLLQMRYIYSMPVERIIKYFADNGFTLRKATANKLIARSADVLENFYKAICQVVLQQDYVSADETYHKVLLTKTKPTDKGSKKGYFWAVSAPKLGLVFFVYEDGSRSEQVILNVFSDYKGTIQSDAYAPYRKLESDAYPDIMRIACLQHVKRDFVDCGKEDKDAQEVVDILNRFYREDKKHKVGVNGWTVEDHLAYRQSYAPDILQDLLEKLEEISSRKDLLPKSTLAQAVGYALNEYNAICDIFKRGDTALDNNYIERIQRYISLSRRNSMFFGSHEGAGRAAILYSIAISCRLNGINLFEYICDVIEKTVEWQPNTPLEKYRNLLPDRWKKQ